MPAKYGDFDMSAEALASKISSSTEYGDNGLVGVCEYDKDNLGLSDTRHRKELMALVSALQNILAVITDSRLSCKGRTLSRYSQTLA